MKRFVRDIRAHHAAKRGIVVTTTTFTGRALTLARKGGIGLMEGRQLAHAVEATEVDHHEFDRHMHDLGGTRSVATRLIRVTVMASLVAMLVALWVGPTIRMLRG